MIKLSEDLYIAKGSERKCYLHPNDDKKLIKIQYNNTKRNQNDVDVYYYNYLKNKDISFSHIPKYYGCVETNKGMGLVFDAIKNYDGMFSKSFEDIVTQKILSQTQQEDLLAKLQLYLSDNFIISGDVVLSNILCQEIAKDKYKLVIVDGLGARRLGFKLWLHTHSKIYTKYRLKKQWAKLLNNCYLLRREI